MPHQLKAARVVPIFKDGDKTSFNNYRPISLISSFGKFIEKVVSHQVLSFLNTHNLLYDNQFGFRKGHSTTHPLIKLTEYARAAISGAEGNYSAAIFIDLKKAFDTVPFDLLLKKLNFYGVRGTANLWFKST